MIKGTLAFAGGIVLLQYLPALPPAWLLISVPLCITALLFRTGRPVLPLLCCALLGFCWALFQAQILLAQRLPPALVKQDIRVSGTVASLPEPFEQGIRFEFAIAECLQAGLESCPQRVRLSWYRPDGITLRPGQRWQFTVRLKPPRSFANPGSFDYSGWLLQKRIVATGYINTRQAYSQLEPALLNYPVQQIRYALQQFIKTNLAEHASEPLVRALLIGDRSDIQAEQWRVLQKTGTVHLMAISGLHVGLIAGLGFILAHWFWRRSATLCLYLAAPRAAAIVAWGMALCYAALAGFAIPTQRALIMLAVILLAVFLQRPVRPSYVLSMALLLVLLLDPFAVLAAGFWLSFAAVALIYYLLAQQTRYRARLQHWLTLQIAISLGVLPLVVLYFQQAPVLSPLANLLAVPWVSFLVIPLAMFSLLLSGMHSGLGIWGLERAIELLDMLYRVLAWAAELPLSIVHLPAPTIGALLLAVLGILTMLLPRQFPARYLGLFLCLPLLFPVAYRPAIGEAAITLLDVGQGLATVVMTREHTLVFDTGPAFSERFDTGEAVVIPYLRAQGVQQIDMLIISHGDSDHIGGAASLQDAMPIKTTLSSVPAKLGHGAQSCVRGQRWNWDGVAFEMLSPNQATEKNSTNNDQSCVLRITAGAHAVLFTGDIETAAETALVHQYGHDIASTVLVVPHHGSKTSSSDLFLDQVRPAIALFPVGWLNRYRHPHPDILARYDERGIHRYDTAQHGAIRVRLGTEVQVEAYRDSSQRYWHVP